MLYKKGCRDDFGNYRAICLLCHAYKILSAVLARRLHLQLADILPDSQAGFRPARGTRDNVCILKWTVNMILREDKEAVITFIDYKAAFDTESQRSGQCTQLSRCLSQSAQADPINLQNGFWLHTDWQQHIGQL